MVRWFVKRMRKKYQWMDDGSQKNVITFDQVNYISINLKFYSEYVINK